MRFSPPPQICDVDVSGSRATNLHVSFFESRMKNLPSRSSQNISSTAILRVLYGNSTNMTSIKFDRTMRRTVNRHTVQVSVRCFFDCSIASLADSGLTQIQAWEFKHPEFKANSKGSLDNIRRKAPAPRKQAQAAEDCVPTQQIDLMNQQLVAQQQQIQQLSDRCNQLNNNHSVVLQEVSRVQKTMLSHQHVIHQVMNFLHSVDARHRRDSKAGITFPAQGDAQSVTEISPTATAPAVDDEPASPLQNASKLLNEMNTEIQFNMGSLDSVDNMQRTAGTSGAVSTPPFDQTQRNGALRPPTSTGSNPAVSYGKANGELETIVYPVGNTNGIDPMYSEHVNNIPYPLPQQKEPDSSDVRRQFADSRKKSTHVDPGWIRSPQILLVEDDPTCRQIGGKFLYSFSCVIDTAVCFCCSVSMVLSLFVANLILV